VIDLLLKKQDAIAAACARYNVARLDAFGSALRHDFVPEPLTVRRARCQVAPARMQIPSSAGQRPC
jgi:hypothetical protein